ncbi:GNAT superfamily N-acetyltransferase [Pseudomonas frederiksbergensis]|jgi:GNAT superfamily N-acetyltransferase|uniref:GNAT family N-acetyltransferase n=1 Tax=Pseudomonas TaxID=286 RepID=UPI000362609F|nr:MULTISPECIES: GNAT family N-acetyltransferase [Pseudomonas]ANI59636.1 acetyltransferase [Pseudomonas sp. GR 6-02]MBD9617107.1 GNAT family N-acetyltransferase [Pseudomonas sp. PDM07]PZW63285.1 acetyltransferase (GNAT) family protein [Pseudomonas sp. URMO17WK12:I6]QDV94937.1 GNAT family N-acetyltransferase [Pseudomonas sp. ATCC 43928]CAH0168808.1 Amino-acid acetyltransferase [Pseudomonas sp. Bi130]
MPRLDWLAHHMHHSDIFASWIHQQFHYEYADQPLPQWQREFADGQFDGTWQCLIALDEDRLLGGAALAAADLAHRPDLGPWLACVFVTPQARGKGLAERLIEGICAQARERGVAKIYLHTRDQSDYYARRGWTVLERFQAWENDQWLMVRNL